MIRLEKHEELVEAIRDALMGLNTGSNHKRAEVAIDALLAAVVEKGVGRVSTGVSLDDNSINFSTNDSLRALILKLEPKP